MSEVWERDESYPRREAHDPRALIRVGKDVTIWVHVHGDLKTPEPYDRAEEIARCIVGEAVRDE